MKLADEHNECPPGYREQTQYSLLTNRLKDITYGCIICDYCKGKAQPNCTRLTVGGDRIKYQGECGTATADILTVKIMLNSIISTTGEKFLTIDAKNVYLNMPMTRFEYLQLCMSNIPDYIKQHYQ